MHRLKAILSPAPVAQVRHRVAALGIGAALAALAGAASVALADQREPEIAPRAAPPVTRALPAPRATPTANRATPAVAPSVLPVAKVEPAPMTASEPAPSQAQVTTNPSWSQMPTPLRFPAAALEQDLTSGSAELSCSVETDGRVSACTILSEEPLGAGFGAAALDAAARARVSPQSVEGVSPGGLLFTVRFSRSTD